MDKPASKLIQTWGYPLGKFPRVAIARRKAAITWAIANKELDMCRMQAIHAVLARSSRYFHAILVPFSRHFSAASPCEPCVLSGCRLPPRRASSARERDRSSRHGASREPSRSTAPTPRWQPSSPENSASSSGFRKFRPSPRAVPPPWGKGWRRVAFSSEISSPAGRLDPNLNPF